jgi:hypothetical protein
MRLLGYAGQPKAHERTGELAQLVLWLVRTYRLRIWGLGVRISSGAPLIPKVSQILHKDIDFPAQLANYLCNNASNKSSNTFRNSMPDFLTRRCGTWHFVRRVPVEFERLDPRGIIKHSTKVRVAQDRTGRRAARVAARLNNELELH